MSKNRVVASGQGLAALGQIKDKLDLSRIGLPQVPKSSLGDLAEAMRVRTWLRDTALPAIETRVTAVAEALALPDEDYRMLAESVQAEDQASADFVSRIPVGEAQRQVIDRMFSVAAGKYPTTVTGALHLADLGLAVGFFIPTEDKGRGLLLPVTDSSTGRWQKRLLAPARTATMPTIEAVRTFAANFAEAQNARRAEREEAYEVALESMKSPEDTFFLKALEDGGQAVVYVPDAREGTRFYPGGHLRVNVSGGVVTAVTAIGGCAGVVGRIVAAGISVPVETVAQERLELKERIPERERFNMTVVLHALLYRGWKAAGKSQARREKKASLRERSTLGVHDFVVEQKPGACFIRLESWESGDRTFTDVTFLAERNDEGCVRVADTLPQFEVLFAGCREFTPAGEKNGSLPAPLGQMLRVLYAKVSASERRKASAERPNPQAEAPAEA